MTTCPSADVATAVPPSVHRDAPEIVAWLVDDGSASAVARTAFREAAHRGGWVRFVELTPANTLASSGAEHERAAFRAVLQARDGLSPVPHSFEVAAGNLPRRLLRSSRGAALLVVGRHLHAGEDELARACRHHAPCDVLTVVTPGHPTHPTAGGPSHHSYLQR